MNVVNVSVPLRKLLLFGIRHDSNERNCQFLSTPCDMHGLPCKLFKMLLGLPGVCKLQAAEGASVRQASNASRASNASNAVPS